MLSKMADYRMVNFILTTILSNIARILLIFKIGAVENIHNINVNKTVNGVFKFGAFALWCLDVIIIIDNPVL